MPQNLPERYFLGRQGRVMWPSFFANVDFCFLRDRLQQRNLIAAQTNLKNLQRWTPSVSPSHLEVAT